MNVLATLKQETLNKGGFTLDVKANKLLNKGYVVSDGKNEKIIPLKDFKNTDVILFIQETKANFVGSWIHEGNVYLDSINVYEDYYTAFLQANRLNEIAMFDLSNFKEIKTRTKKTTVKGGFCAK